MRIVFLKAWRSYSKGQVVDPLLVGLNAGPVAELVKRGVANYESESRAGYQTMTMQPVQTMVRKRGRPAGSKNKPKEL